MHPERKRSHVLDTHTHTNNPQTTTGTRPRDPHCSASFLASPIRPCVCAPCMRTHHKNRKRTTRVKMRYSFGIGILCTHDGPTSVFECVCESPNRGAFPEVVDKNIYPERVGLRAQMRRCEQAVSVRVCLCACCRRARVYS